MMLAANYHTFSFMYFASFKNVKILTFEIFINFFFAKNSNNIPSNLKQTIKNIARLMKRKK